MSESSALNPNDVVDLTNGDCESHENNDSIENHDLTTAGSKVSWPKNDAGSNLIGSDTCSKWSLSRCNYFTSKVESNEHDVDLQTIRSEFSFQNSFSCAIE